MKTTMMWKTSIVPIILLLLAAVTNAVAATSGPGKYRYIVKPRPVDAQDALSDDGHFGSKAAKYIEAKKKHAAREIEVEGLKKKQQDAQTKHNNLEVQINKGRAAAEDDGQAVKDAEQKVTDSKARLKEVEEKITAEKNKEYKEADGDKDAWTTKHKETLENLEDDKIAAAGEVKKAQTDHEELEKFMKDYNANWDFEKGAEVDYTKTDDDSRKKFKKGSWIEKMRGFLDDIEKATEAVKKVQGDRYPKLDSKGVQVVKEGKDQWVEPADGGVAYWQGQMNTNQPLTTHLGDRKVAGFKGQITVLGFYGDAHGTEVLIGSDEELAEVKKLFQTVTEKNDGIPKEETKVFADVTLLDDKEKGPSVTRNSYIRINKGVKGVKDHAAVIDDLEVLVENFNVKVDWKDADGKPVKMTSGEHKDKKNKTVTIKREYLSLQKLIAHVYQKNTRTFGLEEQLIRDSDDYDVLGDLTNMSTADVPTKPGDDTTSGSGSSDKKEGTNAWMIIGIICLIVIFLGGAVIAYRAYTASGSLQNTDI